MKITPSLADLKRIISDPYGSFEERHPELRDAVHACAVPHWFDESLGLHILDAIRQNGRAEVTLERIKHLPFVHLYALKGWQFEPEARKYFIERLERNGLEAEELNEAIGEHLRQRHKELTSNGRGKADRNVRELELRCIYHTFPVDENAAMDGLLQFDEAAIELGRGVDQRATEKVCLEQKRWISGRLVEFWFFEGRHHYVRGEFETAEEFFRKVRESGQCTRIAGIAIHLLGHILWKRRELAEAEEILRESEAIWREIGDRSSLAQTLNTLGCVLRDRGKLPEAEEVLRESEGILREIGDRSSLAQTLNTLGCVLRDRGELPEAEEVLRGGEAILREIGDRPSLAPTLNTLGCVLRDRGKLSQAEEVLREGEGILREIGDRPGLTPTLNTLGGVLRYLSNLPEAEEVLRESEAILREIGDLRSLAMVLSALGPIYESEELWDRAEDAYSESMRLNGELGYDKFAREMESSLRRVHRKRQHGRIANLRRHVREYPKDAHNRAALIVLLQESDPDEALKVAHEGMEITPDNSKLSSAYIDLLITLQKWDQAEEEARTLLQRPPDDLDRQTWARVWNSLGNILIELEEYKEAEDCYRKSQQLGMPEVQIRNNLGLLYARKAEKAREPSEAKRYSSIAEEHFLAAIKALYTKTNFVWPYLNLAELYIVQERYSEANGQLRIVGEKHPAALKFDDIQAKYEDLLARIRADIPNSA